MWQKVSPGRFRLEDALDPQIKNDYLQSADNLIKIELPELDLDRNQRRVIEISVILQEIGSVTELSVMR